MTGDNHPNPIILSFTGGTRIKVISCRPYRVSFVHDCIPIPGMRPRTIHRTTSLVGGTGHPFVLIKRNIRLNNTRRRLHHLVRHTSVPTKYAVLNLSTLTSSRPLGVKVLNVRKDLTGDIGARRYSILVTMNVHFSSHVANGLSACTGRTGGVRFRVSPDRVGGGIPMSITILKSYGSALTRMLRLIRIGDRGR